MKKSVGNATKLLSLISDNLITPYCCLWLLEQLNFVTSDFELINCVYNFDTKSILEQNIVAPKNVDSNVIFFLITRYSRKPRKRFRQETVDLECLITADQSRYFRKATYSYIWSAKRPLEKLWCTRKAFFNSWNSHH